MGYVPPSAINLSVVEEECWVSWGGEDVSTWVTTNGEVTSRVDTVEACGKVSLHGGLEVGDVGVLGDQVSGVLVGTPSGRNPDRNITLEAARIVVSSCTRADSDDF
jgi:hypothetical protein